MLNVPPEPPSPMPSPGEGYFGGFVGARTMAVRAGR